MKKAIIILINKIIYKIGKLVRKGSSLPGRISLKLDKDIFKKIILPNKIIVVTGSNGKTSTTEMICNILERNGLRVGCNKEGSNQTEGVTTMILNACNLKGIVQKDVLVIESDERYTRNTFKQFKPTYLVVTNLYRDQMTRNGHPEHIYNIIKDAITDDISLVLNADDPLSSLFGYKRDNVIYYGMNRNSLSHTVNKSVYNDGKYCPNCKSLLQYCYYNYAHIGSYSCPKCGHKRENVTYAITDLRLSEGQVVFDNEYNIKMNMSSPYSAYNMLAAYSVCNLVGIEKKQIVAVLNNYVMQNDRVQSFDLNGHNAMLLTSKHENSISYNQSLEYVIRENKDCTVVIIIDAVSRKYFTSETSWIWDVDFELLEAKNVKKIILAGKYVYDLVQRFAYTNISNEKICAIQDLDKMMKETKEKSVGNIYVVTCFSDRMKFLDRR